MGILLFVSMPTAAKNSVKVRNHKISNFRSGCPKLGHAALWCNQIRSELMNQRSYSVMGIGFAENSSCTALTRNLGLNTAFETKNICCYVLHFYISSITLKI